MALVRRLTIVSLVLVLAAPGCADEPVSHSETVSVKLGGIKEGDVTDGQASEDKNVNTESGNPYAVFLKNTAAALGGASPARIGVTSIRVRMHTDTTGVNGIDDVFESFEVFLASSDTTVPVGSLDAPTGTDVEVPVTASPEALDALQGSLKSGDFKVGVRGPAKTDAASKFDLRLTVDIVFEAYE